MKIQLPDGEFDAYLFDCDGTLADTMPLHYKAWCTVLKEHECDFPEAFFYQLGGVPTERIVEILNERHGRSMPVEETARTKDAMFVQMIPQTMPIEPVVDLVREFHGVKPLAVASGGKREIVRKTLQALGIIEMFQAIVTVEDYENGKPAPDPFLEAARRLGVAPEKCLVFEDTTAGIASAKAANMQWVLVQPPVRTP
ncbi:MAG TPA: HAD family phosphatase [Verrucomicrobiae bacterium]|nr:HAD family phosphatase [Verrucomicrobiae bacterium]